MQTGQLTADLLLQGYAMGVFPMAEARDDPDVFWVDPRRRGVLPLDGFHISRSLARTLRRGQLRPSVDRAFTDVVAGCADRPETWINDTIFALYDELHDRGFAHSLEVWDSDRLVGGVYGVSLGAAFFGESMFSRRTDASKVALAYLSDRLRLGGYTLFDTQFITPHLRRLGGIEISRHDYLRRLRSAMAQQGDFDAPGALPDPQTLLQRRTQMS